LIIKNINNIHTIFCPGKFWYYVNGNQAGEAINVGQMLFHTYLGVNFINVKHACFYYECYFGSCLLRAYIHRKKLPKWHFYKKCARKMLMKLTTDRIQFGCFADLCTKNGMASFEFYLRPLSQQDIITTMARSTTYPVNTNCNAKWTQRERQ